MDEKKKQKVRVIKADALVKGIDVGATFYSRFQFLLMSMVEEYGAEKATEAIKRLKEHPDSAENSFEENLITVLSFIYLVEQKALEQNLLEEIEVDPDDPKFNL